MMESFSPRRLLARTWADFNRRCVSQGATYVLWGGFEDAEDLVSRYFHAKGKANLLDRRRNLSVDETEQVNRIRRYATEAAEYRDWARSCDGDPLLRDLLVAYCSAFESALKTTAMAFRVMAESGCHADSTFLPAATLRKARKEVRKSWESISRSRESEEGSTAERFYRAEIFERNPDPDTWPFENPSTPASPQLVQYRRSSFDHWADVTDAFKLRNRIVHEGGYLDEQLEFVDQTMPAGDEVVLRIPVVLRTRDAFSWLLYPLNPEQL